VIGHLFGCGSTLASVLGRNELDAAVKRIRNTVLRVTMDPG
jgi:hypothetical protein